MALRFIFDGDNRDRIFFESRFFLFEFAFHLEQNLRRRIIQKSMPVIDVDLIGQHLVEFGLEFGGFEHGRGVALQIGEIVGFVTLLHRLLQIELEFLRDFPGDFLLELMNPKDDVGFEHEIAGVGDQGFDGNDRVVLRMICREIGLSRRHAVGDEGAEGFALLQPVGIVMVIPSDRALAAVEFFDRVLRH